MSVAIRTSAAGFEIPPYPVRQFSVEEYHQMIRLGFFGEDDPVELLEGWITTKMAHNPLHDATVDQIREILSRELPAGWRIRVQSAITTDDSEPEPDLVVVPGPASLYKQHHPRPFEIALLIEVADSSLFRDRVDKGRAYARAGIECYWLVNLVESIIEVYTEPSTSGADASYRQCRKYEVADTIPLILKGCEIASIAVMELLA